MTAIKSMFVGAAILVGAAVAASAQSQYPAPSQYPASPQLAVNPYQASQPYPANPVPTTPPSWSYSPYTSGLGPCPQWGHGDERCSEKIQPTYGHPNYRTQ